MKSPRWHIMLLVPAVLMGLGLSVGAGNPIFEITRSTIDGGGVMRSTGGGFECSATMGQPDAAFLTGANFELTSGFWFGIAPADCDENGRVNLLDHSAFESCLSGPASTTAGGCECFDVDKSGTVDLHDYSITQGQFTGGP